MSPRKAPLPAKSTTVSPVRLAAPEQEGIVAASALEHACPGAADDPVAEGRADGVLEGRQGVGVHAVGRDLVCEVDQHRSDRRGVRYRIRPAATEDLIRAARSAIENVAERAVVAVNVSSKAEPTAFST